MTSYVPPKINTAFITYVGLFSQADSRLLQVNPTLAAGDAKVSIDGGAFNNLATLPAVTPAGGRAVKVSLSASEMNGDNIVVQMVDAAGAEWCDAILELQTSATQQDDAISTVSANKVADHVLRRNTSNVEVSANGDTLDARSLYGAVSRAAHKRARTADTSITTYKSDDATSLVVDSIGVTPSANPVTSVDPP